MESAPPPRKPHRNLGARFNELADDGALLMYAVMTIVLFVPPAAAWIAFGPPPDLLGWAAVLFYGWFAVRIFKGLVLGDWFRDGED